jgi:hypothetical protein
LAERGENQTDARLSSAVQSGLSFWPSGTVAGLGGSGDGNSAGGFAEFSDRDSGLRQPPPGSLPPPAQGQQLFGIFRNISGDGPQWQLYSVDVKTGTDKFLAPVDLPASTDGIAGFSLHPDGKRFLISIAKWPFDIWMMEGFDQYESLLDRLLHR